MSNTVELEPQFDAPPYVPPPYTPRPTVGDRLATLSAALLSTPGRAALATVDGVALLGVAFSLRTVAVNTADVKGPLLAHCGVSSYLFGHPNPAVRQACRAGYAAHAEALVAAGVVAAVATIGLALSLGAARRPDGNSARALRTLRAHAMSSPPRAALATVVAAAAALGLAALHPAAAQTADSSGALRIQCGIGTYAFGHPNPAVEKACRRAFAGHAAVIGLCALLVAGGAAGLARGVGASPDATVGG